ncbi:NADH-dependent glutamate synthase 1 [Striga asiatica]|uniref:NADH-dependent glutamate synthase 1 n=1 Tax=Striga asiatica TaxID=4170 RepID=A0A5A7Q2N9_STRAF|nr:NADH-dependent glutamate synthase 1 [Striga asiatica]
MSHTIPSRKRQHAHHSQLVCFYQAHKLESSTKTRCSLANCITNWLSAQPVKPIFVLEWFFLLPEVVAPVNSGIPKASHIRKGANTINCYGLTSPKEAKRSDSYYRKSVANR